MIVKYRKGDSWEYIDNISKISATPIYCSDLIEQYNKDERYKDDKYSGENDAASYMNGAKLPENIADINKVFLKVGEKQSEWGHNVNFRNLLDEIIISSNDIGALVLLYPVDSKDYDCIALITNQRCFLMNDNGQTVERLS